MTDLGNLAQCMVDSDPEALGRARRLRRKAVVISIFLEALCLAALLVVPLASVAVLPRYTITPIPPYHGGGDGARVQPRHLPNVTRRFPPITRQIVFNPPERSSRPRVLEEPAPEIGSSTADNGASGLEPGPAGPIIPGGSDNATRTEPPRQPPRATNTSRTKISEGVMEGALIYRVDPVYPQIARAMHLSGIVHLRAVIATDGGVRNLEVLSGSPILARAAEEAVRQWRYRPTLLSGTPVEVETYITVSFILGR